MVFHRTQTLIALCWLLLALFGSLTGISSHVGVIHKWNSIASTGAQCAGRCLVDIVSSNPCIEKDSMSHKLNSRQLHTRTSTTNLCDVAHITAPKYSLAPDAKHTPNNANTYKATFSDSVQIMDIMTVFVSSLSLQVNTHSTKPPHLAVMHMRPYSTSLHLLAHLHSTTMHGACCLTARSLRFHSYVPHTSGLFSLSTCIQSSALSNHIVSVEHTNPHSGTHTKNINTKKRTVQCLSPRISKKGKRLDQESYSMYLRSCTITSHVLVRNGGNTLCREVPSCNNASMALALCI